MDKEPSPYQSNVRSKAAFLQRPRDEHPSASGTSSSSFHGMLKMQEIKGHDSSYGKPAHGTKTEFRGKKAGVKISNEVVELCEIIKAIGEPGPNGTHVILFGTLFEFYTKISNKLVGMMIRARKQNLITFEGEMLFQRRDDHVVVTLIRDPTELQEDIEQRQRELAHHASLKGN